MVIYEVESWRVKPGREHEHETALRNWMTWVNNHMELFPEWKSLRYLTKTIAGEETERHVIYGNMKALHPLKNIKSVGKTMKVLTSSTKKLILIIRRCLIIPV